MPLVVPGINSSLTGDNQQSTWLSKLAGKKLGDKHDETVSQAPSSIYGLSMQNPLVNNTQSFARQDLPKQHRVLEPGSMATQDFNEDRMNIHLGEDGTVKHVDFK
ncbi:hypothetical protein MMC27_005685 [Xylographa pallens]|nr:hypothetical protein [Xylographa pallens]